MAKSKRAKKIVALVLTVLSTVMAMALFAASTYAWFTDTEKNGKNKIIAGTLQVDLLHEENGGWISIKENPDHSIFRYLNMFPGQIETETLKIRNEGSLALRYRLMAAVEMGTSFDGDRGEKLSDKIQVYMCFGQHTATSRAELTEIGRWWSMGTLTEVLKADSVTMGKLLPDKAEYGGALLGPDGVAIGEITVSVALALDDHLPDNYQGLSAGEITLTLFATQFTYEEGALGSNYDSAPFGGLAFGDGGSHEIFTAVELPDDSVYEHAITVGNGTTLTVKGGYYDGANNGSTVALDGGSTLNLEGGKIVGDGNSPLISVKGGSTVNIYNGTYGVRDDGTSVIDNDGSGTVNIYGGSFLNWNPAGAIGGGTGENYCAKGTIVLSRETADGDILYTIIDKDEMLVADGNTYDLEGNVACIDTPFYNYYNSEMPYKVDGNGNTVVLSLFPDNGLAWTENGKIPTMATMFTAKNDALVTVEDITFTGETHNIAVGDYRDKNVKHNAVLNNVNIVDLKVCTQSQTICAGLVVHGKAELNSCSVTGTQISPVEPNPKMLKDVGVCNLAHAIFNDCTIGSMYTWEHARTEFYNTKVDSIVSMSNQARKGNGLFVGAGSEIGLIYLNYSGCTTEIRSGATVHRIDVSKMTKATASRLKIEDGATVDEIYDDGEIYYSYADWVASLG